MKLESGLFDLNQPEMKPVRGAASVILQTVLAEVCAYVGALLSLAQKI